MSDGSFECKLSRRTESKDGYFITLRINPADLTPDLGMLRVGASLMIGWSEIIDSSIHKIEILPDEPLGPVPAKERKPFASLPLTQQAAVRCSDPAFQIFMSCPSEEDSAQKVRLLCGIISRSELQPGTNAGAHWLELERNYQTWLTTTRYQDSVR